MIVHAIKKTSMAPIIELGAIQEHLDADEEKSRENSGPFYQYKPLSGRGIAFLFSTFVTMLLLGEIHVMLCQTFNSD